MVELPGDPRIIGNCAARVTDDVAAWIIIGTSSEKRLAHRCSGVYEE